MKKNETARWLEWLWIGLFLLLLFAALFFPLRVVIAEPLSPEEQQLYNAYLNGEIIRLHILANSDSPADQALKLKVRDALIDAFGEMLSFSEAKDSSEAFQLLSQNTDAMLQTARTCAADNGFSGSIKAETGLLALPEKQYGSILLPEGTYRALRITIGEGLGQNWWCVLYPQLCLALSEETGEQEDHTLVWSSQRIFGLWLLANE